MAAMNIGSKQFREMLGGERAVLVEFWAPWCGYCRRIGPAFDRIAREYGEKLIVAKINIDEEPALAEEERIEVVPTLVLYRGGQTVGSVVAPESKAAIDAFIRQTMQW